MIEKIERLAELTGVKVKVIYSHKTCLWEIKAGGKTYITENPDLELAVILRGTNRSQS